MMAVLGMLFQAKKALFLGRIPAALVLKGEPMSEKQMHKKTAPKSFDVNRVRGQPITVRKSIPNKSGCKEKNIRFSSEADNQ